MNTISAVALDRLQTENEQLRRQLNAALEYQQALESALLSVPLYRTNGANAETDRRYEGVKDKWLSLHSATLDRAASRFVQEKERVKAAVMGKVKLWQQRIATLITRQHFGDTGIRIPTAQELLERFARELATI